MGDKRDTQRQHVLKAGTILFDGPGTDCLVRRMSLGGANLEVESQTGIPDSLDLVIDVEHSKLRYRHKFRSFTVLAFRSNERCADGLYSFHYSTVSIDDWLTS